MTALRLVHNTFLYMVRRNYSVIVKECASANSDDANDFAETLMKTTFEVFGGEFTGENH